MKGIKLLFFADTHLGFDFPVRPRVRKARRGQDFFDNFHRIISHARRSRPDVVVHGGDLFFRSNVPAPVIDKTYNALLEFAETGIPLVLVPGNHERSRLPSSLLLGHPNIHVFDEPKTITLSLSNADVSFSGFPFQRHDVRARFPAILGQTGWSDAEADLRLLCFHQAVEGATVGPGNFTFRNGTDVIRMRDIPAEFHAALSGHIHRRQTLTARHATGATPVIYPGSTERTSFAERDEEKGFCELEFTFDASTVSWRLAQRFISLPARPMRDIVLPAHKDIISWKALVRDQLSRLPERAVVRFKPSPGSNDGPPPCDVVSALSALVPEGMIVQFSRAFFSRTRTATA